MMAADQPKKSNSSSFPEIDYYEQELVKLAIGAKHLSFAAYCSEVDEKWKRDIFLAEFHALLYSDQSTGGQCWEEASFVVKKSDFSGHDCVAYLYVCPFLKRFIVTVRGTRTMLQLVDEFANHLFVPPEPYSYLAEKHGKTAKEHYKEPFREAKEGDVLGFVNPYFHRASMLLWEKIKPVLNELMKAKYPDYGILFTGHSLGGALTSLLNLYAFQEGLLPPEKLLLITVGQPRTVDQTLARFYDLHLPYSYLVVMAHGKSTDVVRLLPPVLQLWLDSVGTDGKLRESFVSGGQKIENFKLPYWAHRVTYGGTHFPHHFGVQVLIESGDGKKAKLLPSKFRHPESHGEEGHAESAQGCNGAWDIGNLFYLVMPPMSLSESAKRLAMVRDAYRMVNNHCQYVIAWGVMKSVKSVRRRPHKLMDFIFNDEFLPPNQWSPSQRRAFEERARKAKEAEEGKVAEVDDIVVSYMDERIEDEAAYMKKLDDSAKRPLVSPSSEESEKRLYKLDYETKAESNKGNERV